MTGKFLSVAVFLALTVTASAYEGPRAELGEKLFASPELGTSGKSCATCHPGGEGLTDLEDYGDPRLKQIINTCIRKPLAGEPLEPDSTEMNSLVLYLRTL